MKKDLRAYSRGELFWLDRVIRGRSQQQEAAKLGIGERTYRRLENDEVACSALREPKPKPETAHLLALARRRHGKGLYATAKSLGCTHVTLLSKEVAGSTELVSWWRQKGYLFPAPVLEQVA